MTMTIGRLAAAAGCGVETIRYYEREGVLPAPARRGRYRIYAQDDVARLRFVRRARDLGFSLGAVRALLLLADGGNDCAAAAVLAEEQLADVRARLRDLARMEAVLDRALAACRGGQAAACPLLAALGGAA